MEEFRNIKIENEADKINKLQGHTFLNVAIQIITEIIAEFTISHNDKSALQELIFVRDEIYKSNKKYINMILDKQRREKWIKTL